MLDCGYCLSHESTASIMDEATSVPWIPWAIPGVQARPCHWERARRVEGLYGLAPLSHPTVSYQASGGGVARA